MDYYRPSCSDSCPAEFAKIVHDCIKSNPTKRPTATDVCKRLNDALNALFPAPAAPPHGPPLGLPMHPHPGGPPLGPPGVPHYPPYPGPGEPRYNGAGPQGPPRGKASWASRFCLGFRAGGGSEQGVTVKHQ